MTRKCFEENADDVHCMAAGSYITPCVITLPNKSDKNGMHGIEALRKKIK